MATKFLAKGEKLLVPEERDFNALVLKGAMDLLKGAKKTEREDGAWDMVELMKGEANVRRVMAKEDRVIPLLVSVLTGDNTPTAKYGAAAALRGMVSQDGQAGLRIADSLKPQVKSLVSQLEKSKDWKADSPQRSDLLKIAGICPACRTEVLARLNDLRLATGDTVAKKNAEALVRDVNIERVEAFRKDLVPYIQ